MGKKGVGQFCWEPGIRKAMLVSGVFLFLSMYVIWRELLFSEQNHPQAAKSESLHWVNAESTKNGLRRSKNVSIGVLTAKSSRFSTRLCKLGSEAGSIACCGHRGARRRAPENTLPAFRAAVELGANCLEMDVHMTADGGLAVMHERTMREKYYGGAKLLVENKGLEGQERMLLDRRDGEHLGASVRSERMATRISEEGFASLAEEVRVPRNLSNPTHTTFNGALGGATNPSPQRKRRKSAQVEEQPRVENMGLAEVKELDAGAWFGPQFTGTAVPSLGEVFDSVWEEELQLIVELKAEARCDTTIDKSIAGNGYWDIGASSKAVHKRPSTVHCSSRQYEERYVQSLSELLDSIAITNETGDGNQARFRVLFASFNHRLIDQLTLRLKRRAVEETQSVVQGKAASKDPNVGAVHLNTGVIDVVIMRWNFATDQTEVILDSRSGECPMCGCQGQPYLVVSKDLVLDSRMVLLAGTAYILHPQEVYNGQNFVEDVKWLAPHWSKTESIMDMGFVANHERQVIAWVADDLSELRRQVHLGVSGVITNDPSLCRSLCN